MKMLSQSDILRLLPVTPAEIAETDKVFAGVYGARDEGYFARGIAEGWLHATDIAKDGHKAYRLIWQVINGHTLHCVGLDFIGGCKITADYHIWQLGAELIAARENCTEITFSVKLHGVVKMCQRWGAELTAVTMRKTLKPAIDTKEENHAPFLQNS
jgi:hypothetical protein